MQKDAGRGISLVKILLLKCKGLKESMLLDVAGDWAVPK
jgi:hypothetical protein